jgi:hypothetical protein
MDYKFKTLFIASILALATTHSFAQTAPAVGTTLGDLQSVSAPDQSSLDLAIRDPLGAMVVNYEAALAGAIPSLTQNSAVILQGADLNFGFIEQIIATAEFSYAVIDQTTASQNAYIVQSGDQNYASIVQSALAPSVAYISQLGLSNRAIINQK